MQKPSIILRQSDHARLVQMANGLLDAKPEIADALLAELERAEVAVDASALDGTVQMGSKVEYSLENGTHRTVTLVYPADADITRNQVSVLTPIGVALLGLSEGQTIPWTANDGRDHRLTVDAVVSSAG